MQDEWKIMYWVNHHQKHAQLTTHNVNVNVTLNCRCWQHRQTYRALQHAHLAVTEQYITICLLINRVNSIIYKLLNQKTWNTPENLNNVCQQEVFYDSPNDSWSHSKYSNFINNHWRNSWKTATWTTDARTNVWFSNGVLV